MKLEQDYLTKLDAMIARKEQNVFLFGVVRETIRAMQGQKMTKRVATAVQARLDELRPAEKWTVFYEKSAFGAYRLSIWGDARPFSDRFDTTLCYADSNRAELKNNMADEETYVKLNECFALDVGRLAKMREARDGGHVGAWAADRARIERQTAQLRSEMEAFGLQYLFDL